jgi:hypothetical protein
MSLILIGTMHIAPKNAGSSVAYRLHSFHCLHFRRCNFLAAGIADVRGFAAAQCRQAWPDVGAFLKLTAGLRLAAEA